ncbi:restriction endonuclease subunit S, partial [Marinobacter sp. 1Y8]
MVSDWVKTTLGKFTTLQRGHDLPSATRISGNIPILGSFGITGWHNESKVSGPGVTVGRSGASYGVVSYSEVDYWPLNTALFVKDFHGNHPKFAYYFLKSMDFERYNSGSAVQSLNRNHIHPIEISIPPLPEQKAIAHILGSLDDKIELNRQMNETLEAMAQALFKSWFVDFDPVIDNALAAGNAIPDEFMERAEQRKATERKDNSDIQSLFSDEFEFTEEMGWIPRGWLVKNSGDLFDVRDGTHDSPKK